MMPKTKTKNEDDNSCKNTNVCKISGKTIVFMGLPLPSAQVVMQVDVQKKLNSQMQIVEGSQDSSC